MKSKEFSVIIAALVIVLTAGRVTAGETTALVLNVHAVRSATSFSEIDYGMRVLFPAWDPNSPPPVRSITLVADDSGDGAVFSGDLTAAGVSEVAVTVAGSGQLPQDAKLFFDAITESGSQVRWFYSDVGCYDEPDKPARTVVSFSLAGGWYNNIPGGTKQDVWDSHVRSIARIGIIIVQGTAPEQYYDVTMLQLLDSAGKGIGDPAVLTPLQEALANVFGKKDISALSADELASDLFRKVAAGVDVDEEPEADFNVEVVSIDENGVTVRWRSAPWGVYTLYRADDLISGFSMLETDLRPTAEDKANRFMTYVDETAVGAGPYFYRAKLQIVEE